jgi:glutathione peroxidase
MVSAIAVVLLNCSAHAEEPKKETVAVAKTNLKTIYDFKLTDIDGKEHHLASYKESVVVIVNVASKCGRTPQYAGLEAIYLKYKEKGLTVIGIPCNQFGGQEPDGESKIKAFCTTKYKVTFPMMSKVEVKGDDMCPLYKFLTTEGSKKGEIAWNFEKFIISRKGVVLDRFGGTGPEDVKFVAAVEKALAESK